MARRLGDPGTLAFVLMKTYPSLWQPGDPERRLAVLQEIAELAGGLGDHLRVRMQVLATRASASRPDMGFVNARLDMLNADGVRVMTLTPHLMFGRRPPAAGAGEPGAPAPAP